MPVVFSPIRRIKNIVNAGMRAYELGNKRMFLIVSDFEKEKGNEGVISGAYSYFLNPFHDLFKVDDSYCSRLTLPS